MKWGGTAVHSGQGLKPFGVVEAGELFLLVNGPGTGCICTEGIISEPLPHLPKMVPFRTHRGSSKFNTLTSYS